MIVIGLTGGIGTGKTTVSKILQELGAEIIGADESGHEVYRRGTEAWRELVEAFGDGVLTADGEIDRSELAVVVFQDRHALERLNAIVHPRIRAAVEERIEELEGQGREVAVVEAALLVEASWGSLVDEVWVTVAPEDSVVERTRARNGLDSDAVRARIRSQAPREELLSHADAVIENGGSPRELRERVTALWHERMAHIRQHERDK